MNEVRFKRISRPLMLVAAVLAVVLVAAIAYKLHVVAPVFQAAPSGPLPKIVRGASDPAPQTQTVRTPVGLTISPGEISIVDGDTIQARGRTIRLVGFDTPEVGWLAACERERELAARASARLRSLIAGGGLELRLV